MEIRRLGLDRYALGIGLAVAMLAGCGGAQTTMNGAVPQGAMTVAQGWAHHASGSGGDLLYVADEGDSTEVSIFTYPQGQFYGSVSGLSSAWGTCSDTSGNVYVDTLSGLIYEFAHGSTTPKRTISGSELPNILFRGGHDREPCSSRQWVHRHLATCSRQTNDLRRAVFALDTSIR